MSCSASAFFLATSCSVALSCSIMSLTSLSSFPVSWNAFSASSLVLVDAYKKNPELVSKQEVTAPPAVHHKRQRHPNSPALWVTVLLPSDPWVTGSAASLNRLLAGFLLWPQQYVATGVFPEEQVLLLSGFALRADAFRWNSALLTPL